jgi:hypothetical protein
MKKVSVAWLVVIVMAVCSACMLIGSVYLDNSKLFLFGMFAAIVASICLLAVNEVSKPGNNSEEFYMDWADDKPFEDDIRAAFQLQEGIELKKKFKQLEEDIARGNQ